jgi:catecholate siderophore receptor
MTGTKLIAAALLASASTAALAEDAATASAAPPASPTDSEKSVEGVALAQVEPILVTGQRGTYGVRETRSATKTDTRIIDIPQALTVISEKQVEDQALRSVSELLYFVPGATPGTGEANRDQFTLRGNNTTADLFIDGIRDDAQYFRDFYNVERVEVLKGPNAMIFGRGGGGGVVNRVIKRSTLGTFREGLLSSDSYGGFRGAVDFDQALGNGVGVRVNALYEDGDSFRRHVDLERYGINPTVGFQVGSSTRIDLGYEYFHDRRTTDRGIPSISGEPLKGFDRTFFGDPDKSYSKAGVNIARVGFEHEFAEGLTLRNKTLFADYDKFYQNLFPNSAVLPATATLPEGVTIGAYNSRNDRKNLFSQTDLVWEGRLGEIEQTLLFGFEAGRQKSRNHRQSGTLIGLPGSRAPLADPTVDVDVTFASSASDANNRTRANVLAFYVQDQVRPTDWLEIVAGLRFDSFNLKVDDLRVGGSDFSRTDKLWSPRLGLILKPKDNLSLYGSFSRSYLPQSGDQFSGLTPVTDQLKPERFDNYEIGAKWEPIEGLLATAAVYQLDRTNTQARNDLDQIVLTGAQRSRGVELGLERSITDRWQVSAGYAWQEAEIRKTTAAAPKGRDVPLVPRHSFSLWTRYDFTPGIGAGLGLIARSKSYASISNAVTLPGYARLDAALYYKIWGGMEAQVNLENILGADYFPTAHNDNNIGPGAPRTLKGTIAYRF